MVDQNSDRAIRVQRQLCNGFFRRDDMPDDVPIGDGTLNQGKGNPLRMQARMDIKGMKNLDHLSCQFLTVSQKVI